MARTAVSVGWVRAGRAAAPRNRTPDGHSPFARLRAGAYAAGDGQHLWLVVFVSNILGTATFAAAIYYGGILEPSAFALLLEGVSTRMEYGVWSMTIKRLV